MMEAQSYGVPIVTLGVGGISDLVRPETGILLPGEATDEQIAAAVDEALRPGRFAPEAIRAEFDRSFNAAVNYPAFADELAQLWSARGRG
jgi:glycosyltransferase involved in cell wall biosynthesis